MSFSQPLQQGPPPTPFGTGSAVTSPTEQTNGSVSRSHSFSAFDASLQSNETLASFLSPDLSQQTSPTFDTPPASSPFALGPSQAAGSLHAQHPFDAAASAASSAWPNVTPPEQSQPSPSTHPIPQTGSAQASGPFNLTSPGTQLHGQPQPSAFGAASTLPQTAPVTAFSSPECFNSRPTSQPGTMAHHPEGLAPAFTAVSTETEMTPAQNLSPPTPQSSQDPAREGRAREAFAQLEALLASVRPAVMESPTASPLSTPQANLLDQAWKQFGDYFLRAATISGRTRPPNSRDESADGQTSPDDSYDSMPSAKGDRKRVLSVEGDAPPPPAKRAEASPNTNTTTTSRRLTFGAADRAKLPHLPHTMSSPVVPRASATTAHLTQSTPSVSSDMSGSFTSVHSAPNLPTSSTTFANPLSATPAGNAVVAGLHLPFGSQMNPDQASASTFLPQHTHTPLMPSPLAGSMMSSPSSSQQQHPQQQHQMQSAVALSSASLQSASSQTDPNAPVLGQQADQQMHMSQPQAPQPMAPGLTRNGHSHDDVHFALPTQGYASPPKTSYNAIVHSTPTSPQPRLMAGSYFDAMRHDSDVVVMSRQPPNPRIFDDGPLGSMGGEPSSSAFTQSISPAATVQPSSLSGNASGHGHTKSWAFSTNDPSMSGFASPQALDPSRSSEGINAPMPARRSTRPRANTVGALSSISRPGSPSDLDESYLPAGAGSDQISPDLREEMNTIFVEWLQDLCNDLDATDSKGETIHQTLMAKKMQKLDDMGEYRPFKFRIQAFTNRFAEELISRGLSEAQVPHKIVRVFLWNQPLVSRYNEEGKKAKSKGNHVWSIDARKVGDGKWHFRPFQRRIVMPQTRTAKCGVPWVWEARIWDPQVPSIKANFSSPQLPPWLSWKRSEHSDMITELSGTPPIDATQDREEIYLPIHVEASFMVQDTPSVIELDFELEVTSSSSITSAASLAASAGRQNTQSRPASSGGNSNTSFDVTMSGPSDPSAAFDPQNLPPIPSQHLPFSTLQAHQPQTTAMSSLDVVSAATPFSQKEVLENSPLVHAFAQKQALDPVEAQATVQAYIAPLSLLTKESEVFGQGEGPLASALAKRDDAVSALTYAAQSNAAPPQVMDDLTSRAQQADREAKQAMSAAQANALQSLVLNGPSDSTSVPASSNSGMYPGM